MRLFPRKISRRVALATAAAGLSMAPSLAQPKRGALAPLLKDL